MPRHGHVPIDGHPAGVEHQSRPTRVVVHEQDRGAMRGRDQPSSPEPIAGAGEIRHRDLPAEPPDRSRPSPPDAPGSRRRPGSCPPPRRRARRCRAGRAPSLRAPTIRPLRRRREGPRRLRPSASTPGGDGAGPRASGPGSARVAAAPRRWAPAPRVPPLMPAADRTLQTVLHEVVGRGAIPDQRSGIAPQAGICGSTRRSISLMAERPGPAPERPGDPGFPARRRDTA